MYFPRFIEQTPAVWAEQPNRKPMILRGARQTGKSTTVREFSHRFDLFLELNLEKHDDLALVRACSGPQDLLTALKSRNNLSDIPGRTLLFLDEIQESPEAVRWLRFFKEEHPELAVIAAGSLLEVRLEERGFSFPVGRVTFRTLHPFSFFEFLGAMGKDVLAQQLQSTLFEHRPTPRPIHQEGLDFLRLYLLVGGMPEAVAEWVSTGVPSRVRQVHADLIQSLAEDFHKYRGVNNLEPLEAAFGNLKHHFGRRVTYENFAPGFKSRVMKTALGRLEGAKLVSRVWPTSSLGLPFQTRPKSAPKLLPLDVGLALSMMGTGIEDLNTQPMERFWNGPLAEMFAGQQLLAGRETAHETLHFWVREASRGGAEVDFLLPGPGSPIPVEVKSSVAGTLKSMHQFLFRAGLNRGLRLYPGLFKEEPLAVKIAGRRLEYQLMSVPIYLAEHLWRLIDNRTSR